MINKPILYARQKIGLLSLKEGKKSLELNNLDPVAHSTLFWLV